ncbi:MAG TPA: MFS transporter [Rhizomicrobium sp.]|jgi:predicted MFS family arabinose efflux permease
MTRAGGWTARTGLYFVLLFGAVNLFADFAYEGARSVGGPFLAMLGASGLIAGLVGGFGEFIGYGLRLLSGRWADRSGRYWLITILGYLVQMIAVPALALAGSWQAAAALMVMERMGKAIRNPPRNVMLADAGEVIGRGWAFGVNEALDQLGAFAGPLVVAAVYATRQDYALAFAWLAVPAAAVLLLVLTARFIFPNASEIVRDANAKPMDGYPRVFWWYAAASALVAFGFADYSLIAFHFAKGGVMPAVAVPVVYAFGMLAGGAGSLLFGKMYDHVGLKVLVPVTVAGAFFAPLVFMGGYAFAVFGVLLWGLATGVHESVMAAAVADMIPAEKRASAYGLFTTIFGVAWLAGSAVEGALYDHSVLALVAVAVVAQLAAVWPLLMAVKRTQESL